MITANEGTRHKAYAEMLGVDDYIRKPFAMDQLIEASSGCWRRVGCAHQIPGLLGGHSPPYARPSSHASIVRGQSSLSSRERERSASSLPPVWQRGQ